MFGSTKRHYVGFVSIAVLSAFVGIGRPGAALAGCNLIPQAQPIFRGTLGTLDRPFAGPGDFVELHVRPTICDHTSPGLGTDASKLVVTMLFTPSASGPKRAVVLTSQSCSDVALTAKLATCAATPGMAPGGVRCVQVNGSGSLDTDIVTRNDSIPRLRFRFPDTDAVLAPDGDLRTLAGPATIAVSEVGGDLPCGLINATCETQAANLGLVACVDRLFARDGTCDPTPDPVFSHFTALPPPTDYQATCYSEEPPCTATASSTRFTLDTSGNLLIPVHWQGILVHDETSAVPRLLRATLKPPVTVTLPTGPFVTSLTPQGQRLPPIFEPQLDPTAAAGALTFFGSVDVADTVLRISHRRGVCAGGSNDGGACAIDLDCDGASCVDACTGGTRDGLACVDDTDCPKKGICGTLFDAAAFGALATNGGPVVLPKQVTGAAGICQDEPHDACTRANQCSGADNLCALYALQAQNPVSLDSLTTRTAELRAFTAAETLDDVDRTGDGDLDDVVLTLQDRLTGQFQALGAPHGFATNGTPLPTCGLSGTPQGRAIVRVQSGPYTLPALALEGHVAAFVESEHGEGACDENGDGDDADGILRVFTVPGSELTAAVSPPRAVDPSLEINGQSLAVSNGLVFFRTFESQPAAAGDPAVLEVLNASTGGVTTLCRAEQAAVQGGRVAFLRPESASPTPGCPGGSLNGPGDTDVGDDVVQLWTGSGAVQNLGRAARAVALSDTHVAAIVVEGGEGDSGVAGGGTDLNGDGDRLDGVVQVHPIGSGAWTSTGFAADTIKFCGSVLAFITPEASQGGGDLNGDGDAKDRVLQLYVPATGVRINTGQAAEEVVCNDQIVAFRTSEAAQGNHDLQNGTTVDTPPAFVMQAWDISRAECLGASPPADCLGNSHQAADVCMAEVCDPRTPYKVAGRTVKFLTTECAQRGTVDVDYCGGTGGTDLNGDYPPDARDQVLQVFDVGTARTTTIGTSGIAHDPFQGGPDDEGDGTGGTFFVASGRCIETLPRACTTNADCPAGFCDGGTCKRDHRTCVNDLDCPPGVPCVTGAAGTLIAASPDRDGDDVPDQLDNCPDVANADRADFDGDGVGDACDGFCNTCQTFQCYEIKPATIPPTTVSEQDRFGTTNVTLRYPHRMCLPVDYDGHGIIDPVPHLTGYETLPTPFKRRRNETVTNQFGTIVLDLARRDVLMVPSSMSLVDTPAPLPLPTIDHYQCYRTKPARAQPRFKRFDVSIANQIETAKFTLTRPYRLCVPANKNGENPSAPTHPNLLLCYRSKGNFPTLEAHVTNQFGSDDVTLIHRRELCVPSTSP